jgi:cellulose synthase/poly-beta-1,6-N-acetylglucosamine synthase-like glycosyltransferase
LFAASRLRYKALPSAAKAQAAGHAPPDCMVIPARNEEAIIGRAVRTLPPDSVIVVDDHSEDRTAKVARQAGAGAALMLPPLGRACFPCSSAHRSDGRNER